MRISVIGQAVFLATLVAAQAGWEFVSVTTAAGERGRTNENERMTMKGWVQDVYGKFEMASAGDPMFGPGSYLLTRDGGKTLYLVNPEQKTYSVWDMDRMMDMAGGMMKLTGMTFSEPKVEKLIDERGPVIAGFSTRHYRFRTSYTMEMSFMGFKRSTQVITDQDVWVSPEVADEAMEAWSRSRTRGTGNPELDKLFKAEMSKVKGFPLKQVSVTTQTDAKGNKTTSTATMEVLSLKKRNLPAALFEIPKDYKEVVLLPSAENATAADDEQQESSRPPAAPKEDSGQEDNPLLKLFKRLPRR